MLSIYIAVKRRPLDETAGIDVLSMLSNTPEQVPDIKSTVPAQYMLTFCG